MDLTKGGDTAREKPAKTCRSARVFPVGRNRTGRLMCRQLGSLMIRPCLSSIADSFVPDVLPCADTTSAMTEDQPRLHTPALDDPIHTKIHIYQH